MHSKAAAGAANYLTSRPHRSAARNVRAHAAVGDKQSLRAPRSENVEGNFFVDHTCIDCDTCRWMAPETFTREGNMSAVTHQPENPQQRIAAMQALLSCPTFSIHSQEPEKGELKQVQDSFPIPVAGAEGVYHCGFHDEKSFGGTSYFLVRPEGNVLIDSPRYNPALAKKLEEMGGVKWMFLTHKDDVGDHAKWAKKFNATRLIHNTEVNQQQGTIDCEVQWEGEGPWTLDDGSTDLEFILVPGHSSGSICMFHSPSKTMFAGDHMGNSLRYPGKLSVFVGYSSDPKTQYESTRKLLDYDFLHVLPGHGRRVHFKDATERLKMITEAIEAGA
ncbi:hypothetical protein BSKO_09690 [Bryopsis sp. KO-2023]|nr:hypothetical protein BSKO_09690 [Bryopsis sp. KO-2023]